MIESANNSLRRGLAHCGSFPDTEHLRQRANEWMRSYNNARIHSTLGYMSPRSSSGRQGRPSGNCLIICSKSND